MPTNETPFETIPSEHLLSVAIGNCLGRERNLMRAYIPVGVGFEHAAVMVRAANATYLQAAHAEGQAAWHGDPPFAILVTTSDAGDESDDLTVVDPAGAARYREGDRLAVCVGRIPDLATFTGTFRLVMGSSWPKVQSETLDMKCVAIESLRLCLKVAGANPAEVQGLDLLADELAQIFELLSREYELLGSTTVPWNALWYRHVNEGLWLLADALGRSQGADAHETLGRILSAAFSLPNPGVGRLPDASKLLKALNEHWFDADSIASSAALLQRHPDWASSFEGGEDVPAHPMANIDWTGFGQSLAESGSLLLALASHEIGAANRLLAFQELTVRQFLNPVAQDRAEPLEIFGADGTHLRATEVCGALHLVECAGVEDIGDVRAVVSVPVEIEIPLVGMPTDDAVASSDLEIAVSPKHAGFEGSLTFETGRLFARGRFHHRVSAGEFGYRPAKCHVSLQIRASDVLTGYVQGSATGTYMLLPPAGAVAVLLPMKSGLPSGPPTVLGRERFTAEGEPLEEGEIVTRLTSSELVRIVAWTSEPTPEVAVNGSDMVAWPDRPNLYYADLIASTEHFVQIGSRSIEVLPAQESYRPLSPIVAAARKTSPSTEALPDAIVNSLRGEIEAEIARLVDEDTWSESLGHFFLPTDNRSSIEPVESAPNGAFLTTAGLADYWPSLGALDVPAELLGSEEAHAFRKAFRALGVEETLRQDLGEQGTVLLWPSRLAWGHLWEERARLQDYLTAFQQLVARARQLGSPIGIHWASYPFSVSAWATRVLPAKCMAVYLSPLHPLRLTWLAAVENTLRQAPEAPSLVGAIEGWNFPTLGPNESRNGKMLAIPADSGVGGLFLGWSMLTRASIENPEQHRPPEYVANRRAPGSSASGLNGGGALAAIKDYRRLHPFTTTITIDLAASAEAPRLDEIDSAILGEVADWASSDDTLLGGARIFDSLNRLGDAPRDLLSETVSQNGGVPLVWRRYKPRQGEEPAANIRVLQDAGVAVAVEESHRGPLGVVASVPLRRFEASANEVSVSATTSSSPVIISGSGWAPFVEALREVEAGASSSDLPILTTQLVGGLLASSSAEWTVSGESLVTPAALAKQIQEHSSDQSLWEWRPPFLNVRSREESAEALLERRPFLSVVRIPDSLVAQLQARLTQSYGVQASHEQARHVLRTLGSRGVGLSSLLAIGGAHATGALGFFTALELLDLARPSSAHQFVIPIDACDKFLVALIGNDPQLGSRRRADLLVVRVDDSSVTMVAVEIKNYGFATPRAHFPAFTSSDLDEPSEQLASTQELLVAITARWEELQNRDDAERNLWLNSLAALVEAGVRLSPADGRDPRVLSERLQKLVDGSLAIRAGRPILTYFQHGPVAAGHEGYEAATQVVRANTPVFAALLADPAATAAVIDRREGPLLEKWCEVVETSFALAEALPEGESPESGATVVPTLPEPQTGDIGEQPKGHAPDVESEEESASILETPSSGEALTSEVVGDGVRFPVGKLQGVIGAATAEFWPGNTKLTQLNIGIAGDLGTGKTQLIKALVANLRQTARLRQPNPLSVLVLDYKGDFEDSPFLESVGGRVLHPNKIPLNFFELPAGFTRLEAVRKAGSFIDVLTQIYQGIGPVQQNLLRNVIIDAYATGTPPTIDEVLAAYKTGGGGADSVVGVLETFVLSEIFATRGDRLESFDELMRDSVTVVNLLDLGSDQKAKNAIVALFLNQYYEYMSRLPKWPYQGVDPQLRRLNSYLLVDEATNIMQYKFDALEQLLLQGREFGVGVILSSQYLNHFKESGIDYGQALRTWFVHRVPNVTVQQLQRLGLPHASVAEASRIAELATHEAYYSTEGFPGRFITGTPFYRMGEAAT